MRGLTERCVAPLRKSAVVLPAGVDRAVRLIAFGSFLTVVAHSYTTLFAPLGDVIGVETRSLAPYSFFSIAPQRYGEILRLIACAAYLSVALGSQSRLLAILHSYLTWSFAETSFFVEGGDQLASNLLLLALPMRLSSGTRTTARRSPGEFARVIVPFLRLQVAVVYLHSALAKPTVPAWLDGTALFYWLHDPLFGAPEVLLPVIDLVLLNPVGVAIATYGSILLEVCLAFALVSNRSYRRRALFVGLVFHGTIAILIGLWSFSMIMFGALMILCDANGRSLDRTATALRRHLRKASSSNEARVTERAGEAPPVRV